VQEARARPGELVLGQLTVVVLRNLGRFEEAAELASAAMYRFPSSEESARLAAEASMQAGWWEQARVGAQQWRQRSAAPQARMAVVESRAVQELGRWDEALRIIQPYAPVEGEPVGQASPDVIEQYARALAASGRVDRARQLLEPLLGGDASWRRLWLALAVEAVDHPGTAAGWMDRLAEATPAEDDGAWLAIGQGWLLMARRFEDPAYAQRALQLMQQRVAAGDAGLDTRLMLAMSAEVAGRLDLAERSYREVMAQRPSDLAARNNLAMLLVNRGGDGALAEALSLAEAVVAQSPEEPNYLDTLASVQSAMGDRDAAIRTLERAVRLDPSNRTWAEHLRRMRSD
jgi:tetratricopeptide (TPR) repeat protein